MGDDTRSSPQPRQRAPRGTETILFADDDEDVRRFVSMTLESLGYTVLTAVDGGDALRALAEHDGTVHCLLTDIVMPDMTGFDLGRSISRDYPAIRILYLTAHLDHASVRNLTRTNAMNLLRKPLTPLQLGEKIRAVLDSER